MIRAGVIAGLLAALSACDPRARGPADIFLPRPDPAGAERLGPVAWDEADGRFEIGGRPLRVARQWNFDGSTEGFSAAGAEIVLTTGAGVRVTNTAADAQLRSPSALLVDGSQFDLVLVRLTRVREGALWDGSLYYSTPAHGEDQRYVGRARQGANPAVGETVVLVYDMARASDPADWAGSLVDRIRIDTDDAPGAVFLLRQVAVARRPR